MKERKMKGNKDFLNKNHDGLFTEKSFHEIALGKLRHKGGTGGDDHLQEKEDCADDEKPEQRTFRGSAHAQQFSQQTFEQNSERGTARH